MKKIAKYLLFANLFFLQSYLIRFELKGVALNLQYFLVAGAGVMTLLYLFDARRWPEWRKYWVLWGFAGLSLVSLLVFGGELFGLELVRRIDAVRHLIFLVIAGSLCFMFFEVLGDDEERIQGVRVLSYGALAFGVFSVVYNLLGFNVTHDYRLLGPMDSAVYLAYYLVPAFLFLGVMGIEKRCRWDILAAILLGGMLVATRSMGALGGSFLVLVWYLLRRGDLMILKKWWVKVILGVVGVVLVAAIVYLKILPTINTPWSSLDERGEIWASAGHLLQDWRHFVFGVGLSQFEANYQLVAEGVLGRPPLDFEVIQPHNLFLLFWFHYGVLGVVFLSFLVWRMFRRVWVLNDLNVGVMAGLIGVYFVIHGMIDTPFYKNDLLFVFILMLQLVVIDNLKRKKI